MKRTLLVLCAGGLSLACGAPPGRPSGLPPPEYEQPKVEPWAPPSAAEPAPPAEAPALAVEPAPEPTPVAPAPPPAGSGGSGATLPAGTP